MKWKTQKIKVSNLKEFEKNPRKMTKKGLSDLKKSIQKFGLAEPIVVNTDMTICGGHGRLQVLKELGILDVDCYVPEKKLTEKEFEELNIRLNANIAGEWNLEALSENWDTKELEDWGLELELDWIEEEEKLEEEEEEIKAYKKIHFLISCKPEDLEKIQKSLEEIKKHECIEFEQSAN